MSITAVSIPSLFSTVDSKVYSSDTIMFYGWSHCGWESIKKDQLPKIIALGQSVLKRNFDWKLSSPEICLKDPAFDHNVDGRKVSKIIAISNSANAFTDIPIRIQLCKATLVNIVFENYTRLKSNLPMIPVFFAIDTDNNPYPTTPATICSKDPQLNGKITHKELRRAYKLCHDKQLSQKIKDIAKITFVFVKTSASHATFTRISAPWDSPDWLKAFQSRKTLSNKNPPPQTKQDWRALICKAFEEVSNRVSLQESNSKQASSATATAVLEPIASATVSASAAPSDKTEVNLLKDWGQSFVQDCQSALC